FTYTGTGADAAAVQAALNGLQTIGGVGGTATVVLNLASPANPVFTVTLGGALSGFSQPLITVPAITSGTAGGVAKVTAVVGGAGYSATPTVTITGGGGAGAAATATVVGGVITGFAVTNPGAG